MTPCPAPRSSPSTSPSLEAFLEAMADAAVAQNTTRSAVTAGLLREMATMSLPGNIGVMMGGLGLLTTFVLGATHPPGERLHELAFWFRLGACADVALGHRTVVRVDARCAEMWSAIAAGFRARASGLLVEDREDFDRVASVFEFEAAALRNYLGIDEISDEDPR
jgi:hypothetical protein